MVEKMVAFITIFSLVIVKTLAADDSYPCLLQFDANVKCILELVGSEDTRVVENKTKAIFHTTCAPDYPLDCFAEFEAAKECYVNAKEQLDVPGRLKKEKDSAFAAAQACLGNASSNNFIKGLEEIFMPSPIRIISGRIGNSVWGDGGGKGFGGGQLAAAILKGIATTTQPPPPEKVLETATGSTDSGFGADEKQEKVFGRPECAMKPKQFLCTFKEMRKLADTDPEFKNATDSLKKGVSLCKKVIEERCSPSTQDETRCVADAHLPLILAFVDVVVDCMKTKGYTLPPVLPTNIPRITLPPKSR